MKRFLHIALALIIPLMGNSQVFFNGNPGADDKIFHECAVIPTIHFGYSIKSGEFMNTNNGLEQDLSFFLPEIYIGCQLVADGYLIGIHYGVLQKSIMLGGGFAFFIKWKKKSKL